MAKVSRMRRMNAEDFADFCANASVKDIQKAIEAGSEWDGRAFISAAASNTDPNVLWLLLREAREKEINLINVRSKESRQTALHWAAGHNDNPDVTRVLIAAGANVNARDNYGQTPLEEAEAVHRMRWKDNRQEVIEMLKRAGAR
ncbi:MAG: ankyrin repeat domain-containing protein [Synergistaceae bacterium]|nr:ankyrin repeat domain-containing protein [Synergistaceae bacterium]MBQ3347806.1 ankyrin repeat domain-containing protein [Synergistaceae bacterium]MBQ3399393.1 ankyrin repeat domain-containing protein [Synergistaceae bacterium]MBQ3759835.1 ankyrin repeat domain-containing protein [Synergistaceae bacterium]MBQ4402442.1 ankyrin repeat domain-containing protein [Synergistaceae bacterium]